MRELNLTMKPTIEELRNEEKYRLILAVPFENLLPFLFDNMSAATKTMRFFYSFLIMCALSVIFFVFQTEKAFGQIFWYGLVGFLSSFTIMVPIHELLHGLAFKIFGARKLKFGKDIKQMMFYVTVNNFVMNRRQFSVLALLPFITVTFVLLALELLVPGPLRWFCLSAMFWHATMCIGDFAMLSFFEKNKNLELYTFDDVSKKSTYFYVKAI